MKRISALIFCLCIIFSSFCFAENNKQKAKFPMETQVVNSETLNIFCLIGNWFEHIFRRKSKIIKEYSTNVDNLILSRTEIVATCVSTNNSCSNNSQSIEVSTITNNQMDDDVTYAYIVSVGKIIGKGAKVVWDLSGVKAGNYTITAETDDGCRFCGSPKTKTVTVKECPDCQPK